MASESPYTRYGQSVEGDRAPTRHALTNSQRESLLQVAHRRLGEWRFWRSIAVHNDLVDPMDLAGHKHAVLSELIIPFELVGGGGSAPENLTEDLGQMINLMGASFDLAGTGYLVVNDIDDGVYELAFQAPGDALSGAPVTVSEADFEDVDGASIEHRFVLYSVGARYAVDIAINIDLWLILWLTRVTPIQFEPTTTRAELLIPEPELAQGRGQ